MPVEECAPEEMGRSPLERRGVSSSVEGSRAAIVGACRGLSLSNRWSSGDRRGTREVPSSLWLSSACSRGVSFEGSIVGPMSIVEDESSRKCAGASRRLELAR